MTKIPCCELDHYNNRVIPRIMEKYGWDEMKAAKAFILSETHRMLEDAELAMWEFAEFEIFEMWEVEQITGDPRNSIYIRGESA